MQDKEKRLSTTAVQGTGNCVDSLINIVGEDRLHTDRLQVGHRHALKRAQTHADTHSKLTKTSRQKCRQTNRQTKYKPME